MGARIQFLIRKCDQPDLDIWGNIVQDDVSVALFDSRIQLSSRLELPILVLACFSQAGLVFLPLTRSNR